MKKTKLKKVSKHPTKKLAEELEKISHDYIRRRDSSAQNLTDGEYGGFCFDCGTLVYGQQFQAGHFIPDASGGAILRYHPHNMHGQAGGCNMKHSQERVKINYTIKMQEKYGVKYVNYLLSLKNKTIKADEIFYKTMIDLYKQGNEKKIVKYLESL